jgi:hypothetical protein
MGWIEGFIEHVRLARTPSYKLYQKASELQERADRTKGHDRLLEQIRDPENPLGFDGNTQEVAERIVQFDIDAAPGRRQRAEYLRRAARVGSVRRLFGRF